MYFQICYKTNFARNHKAIKYKHKVRELGCLYSNKTLLSRIEKLSKQYNIRVLLQNLLLIFLKSTLKGFLGGAVVKNRLTMQGTWVLALVQEDPTCRRATKPVRHNY